MQCIGSNESPLYNLFNDAVFSYEAKCLKPNSDIYNIAIQRMNVNPKKSVFIGDGGSDELLGARRVGMETVFTEYLDIKEPNKRKKMEFYDRLFYRHYGIILKVI